jgi:hypothetical protein
VSGSQPGQPAARGKYLVIKASYEAEPKMAPRYRGNPFCIALPFAGCESAVLHERFNVSPPKPDASVFALPSLERMGELNTLKEWVYRLPEYPRCAEAFISILREAYVARNPMLARDRERRTLLHTTSSFVDKMLRMDVPVGWRSTASTVLIHGVTGSGKTTFARLMGHPFSIVIRHESYNGDPLRADQIPYIYLQIPFDSNVKSFCLAFFAEIDSALGYSHYFREASGLGSIAEMVILMARVATSVSLGVIFIEEFQNLKVARQNNVSLILNLISSLVELAGISVFISGTPRTKEILETGSANHRKLVLSGEVEFSVMRWDSPELVDFMDKCWAYSYVAKPGKLTRPIRQAWYLASGGNPAFIALAFILAQRFAIGSDEEISAPIFEYVSQKQMATLQPVIRALIDGSEAALRAVEGMSVSKKLNKIYQELGMPALDVLAFPQDDSETPEKPMGPVKKGASGRNGSLSRNLPASEDPLKLA